MVCAFYDGTDRTRKSDLEERTAMSYMHDLYLVAQLEMMQLDLLMARRHTVIGYYVKAVEVKE